MDKSNFLYFAYGSNMFSAWLQKRCRSARAIGIASLSGYELKWNKSSQDKSGKCNIAISDAPNSHILGVLYEIQIDEKGALDAAEGGYKPIEVKISFASEQVMATTYTAKRDKIDPLLCPYTWYRALVVAGAREHGFPEDYIKTLAATEANEDHLERHRNAMDLIGQVDA